MTPQEELHWVRTQLDSLALTRLHGFDHYRDPDRERYQALCRREKELLELLQAVAA